MASEAVGCPGATSPPAAHTCIITTSVSPHSRASAWSRYAATRHYVGHPGIGALYGTGSALIADEFALLLDLKDVYWAKQGRISVDVSLGILSALGLYLTAVPFWHEIIKVSRDHVRERLAA
ncbi:MULTISPECIES: hypothetical protein [unclassified Streptomyces]|uniref:hypothetical protein n=1 Tax=unclassified Streptomyces TaxID=2593676 RepID=UPI001F0795EA|nr:MULTISPECIES: hypothetical protein [unclassified Streptomyces]